MSEAPYPPAEVPADGDRTSQVPPPGAKYSASASVPVPSAGGDSQVQFGPNGPSGAFGQVPSYGQAQYNQAQYDQAQYNQAQYNQAQYNPAPYGQGAPAMGQAPMGQASMGQASMGQASMGQAPMGSMGQAPMGSMGQAPMGQVPMGQAGQPGPARASAAVQPPAGGTYGAPTPGGQPTPATYGSAPQGYPSQPGVYGQPAGGAGGVYGGNQPPQGAPQGYGQGQTPPQAPMGQNFGQPQYGQQPAPQGDQGRGRDKMTPTGGWPSVEQTEAPARKSRKGLTIAVVVLAILVVAGVGSYVGWKLANRGDVYTVGNCVRQDGTQAVIVDCGESGAFKITQVVDDETQCPDATQPSLLLADGDKSRVACLGPA